jgi:hypothetical protein
MKIFLLAFFFFTPQFIQSTEWELQKSKDNIKVYTRTFNSANSIKEFKAVTTSKSTKKNIESVLLEVEKMPEWYDKIKEIKILKKLSPTSAIYRITFDFPVVNDRYTTLKASLKYDQQNNLIVQSKYEPYPHTPVPSAVFVTEVESKWVISGQDNALRIEHTGYMNPSGSIPEWAVNSSLVDGPIRTLQNFTALTSK